MTSWIANCKIVEESGCLKRSSEDEIAHADSEADRWIRQIEDDDIFNPDW